MLINHVYSGDCVKVMEEHFEDESVNVVVADPPYNISGKSLEWEEKNFKKVNEQWDTMSDEDYLKFTKNWLTQAKRVLTPSGTIFVCTSSHNVAEVKLEMKRLGLKEINFITWYKTNAMRNMTRRTLTHSAEYILWASKGPGYTFNYWESKAINPDLALDGSQKQMSDVWMIPRCGGKERVVDDKGETVHSTQKPEKLIERALRIACKPDDVVLDPFLGVGTTVAVAKRLGLNGVGIELDPRYVPYAEARIKKVEVMEPVWSPKSKTEES
jgi:site-specific DNA-methyltransferase (adenine-specific)/modification methylase